MPTIATTASVIESAALAAGWTVNTDYGIERAAMSMQRGPVNIIVWFSTRGAITQAHRSIPQRDTDYLFAQMADKRSTVLAWLIDSPREITEGNERNPFVVGMRVRHYSAWTDGLRTADGTVSAVYGPDHVTVDWDSADTDIANFRHVSFLRPLPAADMRAALDGEASERVAAALDAANDPASAAFPAYELRVQLAGYRAATHSGSVRDHVEIDGYNARLTAIGMAYLAGIADSVQAEFLAAGDAFDVGPDSTAASSSEAAEQRWQQADNALGVLWQARGEHGLSADSVEPASPSSAYDRFLSAFESAADEQRQADVAASPSPSSAYRVLTANDSDAVELQQRVESAALLAAADYDAARERVAADETAAAQQRAAEIAAALASPDYPRVLATVHIYGSAPISWHSGSMSAALVAVTQRLDAAGIPADRHGKVTTLYRDGYAVDGIGATATDQRGNSVALWTVEHVKDGNPFRVGDRVVDADVSARYGLQSEYVATVLSIDSSDVVTLRWDSDSRGDVEEQFTIEGLRLFIPGIDVIADSERVERATKSVADSTKRYGVSYIDTATGDTVTTWHNSEARATAIVQRYRQQSVPAWRSARNGAAVSTSISNF